MRPPPRLTDDGEQAFAWLIDPVDSLGFFKEYWERKPLIVRRADARHYDWLLSASSLDEILASETLTYPQCKLVRDGVPVPVESFTQEDDLLGRKVRFDALYREFANGATVILNRLQARHQAQSELCHHLERVFHHPCQTNIYVTPPNSRGFACHYDSHDVFVLQTQGSKTWRIHEGPIALPVDRLPFDSSRMKPGKLIESFTLSAGSLLYIPRGFMHSAESNDEVSVHITLGVTAYTWSDLIEEALRSVVVSDRRFREALPAGFATGAGKKRLRRRFQDLTDLFGRGADFNAALDALAERFVSRRLSSFAGGVASLGRTKRPGIDDVLVFRPTGIHLLRRMGDRIELLFNGKKMSFPDHTEPALRSIISTSRLGVRDIAGDLDNRSKLVLARRLVQEGFVSVESAPRESGRALMPALSTLLSTDKGDHS
jgi:hypothetical protein